MARTTLVKNPKILANLRNTWPSAIAIGVWILIIHVAAVALFASGFLLTRPVFTDISSEPSAKPAFTKAVVLVVDALRYDFAAPASVEEVMNAPFYLNQLPFQAISDDPNYAALVKFIADPPTTTLQRLKGLTTGSLPTFIDAGSNFAGTQIDEDNWVSQMARVGRVGFTGDDTWQALYGHLFAESHPFDSLDVPDLDTVDQGVMKYLPPMIANSSLDIVIGHMLGVDHVGHIYGPNHPAMKAKLLETGEFIKEVASQIDDKTVLFVFGDHGMDQTGNHGGDSNLELDAALWMYNKGGKFMEAGPSEVRQIDFVPTISGLLGLPVPFNNLGFPIQQTFGAGNFESIALATAKQISQYAARFNKLAFEGRTIGEAHHYQKEILNEFRATWVKFNLFRMSSGIALLVGSLIMSWLLYNSLGALSLATLSRNISLGGSVGTAAGLGAVMLRDTTSLPFVALDIGVGMSVGAILGSLTAVPFLARKRGSKLTVFGLAIVALQSAVLFSNSYVIWEPKVLLFLTVTVLVVLGGACADQQLIVRTLGLRYTAYALVVLRACSYFIVCREENGESCTSTFYESGSTNTPVWNLYVVSFLTLAEPIVLARFWAIGRNYNGVAKLLFRGGTAIMMMTLAYWSIVAAERRDYIPTIPIFRIVLSRAILATTLLAASYIWYRSDLAIEVEFEDKQPRIGGYNNVYGSYALLPLITLFGGLLLVNKPPGIIAMCGLMYCIMSSYDLTDLTNSKSTLLPTVLFGLLGNVFFYWTGHQATLASIQWDTAFVTVNKLSYPLSAITVFLNTFGPYILTAIASTLIPLWRRQPFKEPRQILALVVRAAIGASVVAAIQTVTSMVAATILRRHLMTWKIFAPRFMISGLVLGVIDVSVIVGIAIGVHTIDKVAIIFS